MHNPPPFARGLALPLMACGLLAVAGAGEIAVLYDAVPGTPETLVDQGFQNLSSDLLNQTGYYQAQASTGGTAFDSGPENSQVASFFTHGLFTGNPLHPGVQELDRVAGFRVSIELAIESETHATIEQDRDGDGTLDTAGFSIAVISSDLKGIGISFWEDRIWVNEDDSGGAAEMLTQAEGIDQPGAIMNTLRRYDIEIKADAYRLRADGGTLLTGRLRDYRNFAGVDTPFGTLNNFDKGNSISMGDATRDSRSRALIGDISSETPYVPKPEPLFEIELAEGDDIGLRWGAVPGTVYSLRSNENLDTFEEFNDITADAFVMQFTDTRPRGTRRFYKIVPLGG